MLNEKANSRSQQRLMGMVYAYKNGEMKLDKLPKSLSDKIKGIADGTKRKTGDKRKKTKGMSIKSAKDYASTKHKGLPEKIKENNTMEDIKITKFNDFLNENKLNESDEFGVVNIHIDGEGWIKKTSIDKIKGCFSGVQGEVHLFVDGEEINPRYSSYGGMG